MRGLEEILLRYGGAQREQRRLLLPEHPETTFATRDTNVNARMASMTIARSVETLAIQQCDYNRLEDDDLQHSE